MAILQYTLTNGRTSMRPSVCSSVSCCRPENQSKYRLSAVVSHLGHRHSCWLRDWRGSTQESLCCSWKRMALGFDRFNFHLRAAQILCVTEEMLKRLILRQDEGLMNLKSLGLKSYQDANSPPETTETLIILPVLICM